MKGSAITGPVARKAGIFNKSSRKVKARIIASKNREFVTKTTLHVVQKILANKKTC